MGKIDAASNGAIALVADSSENINMNLGGYGNLSLGAVGNVAFSGNLTNAAGQPYRLGGGGGTLTLNTTFADPTAAVAISGPGTVRLGATSLANRDLTLNNGTLDLNGQKLILANGNTLSGAGTVSGSVLGNGGSAIVATGDLALGDPASYTGFNHAGTLDVGGNSVTLNSKQFANLGVSTTLSGGTLGAPNGVSIGVGCALSGSGTVNGKIAAGFGSTINATGNLNLGDSTSPVGFVSNGELYTNNNTVTLNSAAAAGNKNAVVLGSLTQIEGGTLAAPNGFLLANGNNLISNTGGTVSNVTGGTNSRFLNRGNVQGPAAGPSWLTFYIPFKGSTGVTGGRIGFLDGFSTGDSPGINTHNGDMLLGGVSEFDLGGETPGNGDSYYGQLNVTGSLSLQPGATFSLVDWNDFMPNVGEQFTILTWGGSLSGAGNAAFSVDPFFAQHGISFAPQWQSNSLVVVAVPEPSTLVLLGIGALGLLGWTWRRRNMGGQE
ncbi:MAG: PEP-CTERM sorting domain-containing protein [Thermoguttaceae bacterium]